MIGRTNRGVKSYGPRFRVELKSYQTTLSDPFARGDVVICIYGTKDKRPDIGRGNAVENTYYFAFDTTEDTDIEYEEGYRPISRAQAKAIAKIALTAYDNDQKIRVVSRAKQNRGAAVAAAIAGFFDTREAVSLFCGGVMNNITNYPNMTCYRMIQEELEKLILEEDTNK